MKPQAENWLKISNYDLKSAASSFKEGFYLKAVESCHASIEKLIKGIIADQRIEPPPKIHDLLKLASLAVIQDVSEDIKKLLDELNDVYLSTRYPDNIDEIINDFTKEKTQKVVNKVEEVHKWLMKKLK